MTTTATPINTIEPLVLAHRQTFLTHKTRDLTWRTTQLTQLGLLIQENHGAFEEALKKDLGRPRLETIIAELNYIQSEVNVAKSNLKSWAKYKNVKTEGIWKLTKARMTPEPKGCTLIIGAFNYPVSLLFGPLVGAIAAGCPAILKPSEVAENVARVVNELVPKYLDPSAYAVVLGAIPETTELLRLRFDHIFYTGSGNVGRVVATAAAKHLTSVTLELGGKSPVLVLDDADVKIAGRRIAWSQFVNAAQTCIAPDYILCTKEMQPKLIAAFKSALLEFTTPKSTNPKTIKTFAEAGYTHIINSQHFNRLSKLIEDTTGKIVVGGTSDASTNSIDITLVADCKPDDALMKGENFGPILPILVMKSIDEMIEFVNSGDQPLALYVFTNKAAHRDYIFNRTRSGSLVQNDSLVQFSIPGLEFGGVGPSGTGSYHGLASFTTFSHSRASAVVPNYLEVLLAARYPPYTQSKLNMLLMATKAVVSAKKEGGKGKMVGIFVLLLAVLMGYKKLSA